MITFDVSFRRPPWSENSRGHHMKKYRALKPVVDEGKQWAMIGRRRLGLTEPITTPVQARLVWTVPDRRARDSNNSAPTLKAFVDGLVRGGFLARDDSEHVREVCDIEITRGAPMTIRVEITALPTQVED